MQEATTHRVSRRRQRRTVPFTLFAISLLLLGLWLPPGAAPWSGRAAAAPPEQGQVAVRYTGRLLLTNTPAPVGTVITAIAIPRWPTVVVCGTGTVSDAVGTYSLDIQPTAPVCVRGTATDPPAEYIFMANGENVGIARSTASLAAPASLAQSVRRDLSGTLITGVPTDTTGDPHPVAVRYYGTLRGGNVPAPMGTTIVVNAGTPGAAGTPCGTGTVQNEVGAYWVDIPTIAPGCVRATTTDPPAEYIFLVNGENVGTARNTVSLASPATLARAVRRDLSGRSPFPPPAPPAPSPSGADPAQPAPDTSPTPPVDEPAEPGDGAPPAPSN